MLVHVPVVLALRFSGSGDIVVAVDYNMLNETAIVAAIESFVNSLGHLTISAEHNQITTLPPYVETLTASALSVRLHYWEPVFAEYVI